MYKSKETNEKETKAIINKCKNRQAQSKRQLQREKHRKGSNAKADKQRYNCKRRQMQKETTANEQRQRDTNAIMDKCESI